MSEYWVNPVTGSDAGTGTQQDPWRTVPGMTGGNAVVANDIINVRNGTTVFGRLVLPANNLIYRGYGLADNILMLTIPYWKYPNITSTYKVVRSPGVHEGMWTIDATGETLQGAINYSSRTGCSVEDVCIVNARDMASAVSIGTSAQAQIGATIKRAKIDNARVGISAYRPNLLIEDVLVSNTQDEGIAIGTSATQSLHAGGFVTIRRAMCVNNGIDEVSAIGDPIQLYNSTGFAGTLNIEQCYIRRNVQVKQGIMLGDVSGTVNVLRNHLYGETSGNIQIGIAGISDTGRINIKYNHWNAESSNGNPLVRLVTGDGGTGNATVSTVIDIEYNSSKFNTYAGLFSWAPSTGTIAGTVYINNNTCIGDSTLSPTSWGGFVGLYSTGTIAGTATAFIDNNIVKGTSSAFIRLPTGSLNDARWKIRGNILDSVGVPGYVGAQGAGTQYNSVTTLQAAHSAATGNTEGISNINEFFRPLPGSIALTGRNDLGYVRDVEGKQGRKYAGNYTVSKFSIK